MSNSYLNTLVILVLALFVAAMGYYQTEKAQPRELQQIEDQKKLVRLQQAEFAQLFEEEATSAELAEEATRKWKARYKYIPGDLNTPAIMQYLEGLSATGFEQFDIELAGRSTTPDFSAYLFRLSGTAYYTSLYKFVWQLENNREFYQVDGLTIRHQNVFKANDETGLPKQHDMVSFDLSLKVFYNGIEGLSAPPENEDLVEIPEELLPSDRLPHNSFYPIVRTDLPPNDELLLDVEKATLISIVGDRAIFEDNNGQHVVREGDKIYLGQIDKVDPINVSVQVTLNKGGVRGTTTIKLEVDEQFREAQRSNSRLAPINNNN